MLFEMLTGKFLFDPKKTPPATKSENHLALMMQLLYKFPKRFMTIGLNWKHYSDVRGNLKNTHHIDYLSLKDHFTKIFYIKESEAIALAEFLEPMLRFDPRERVSAEAVLKMPWLEMDTHKFYATKEEITANPEIYDT